MARPGVVRSRVGYMGGVVPNPTYKAIADYTETTQIEFDPTIVTYEDLLQMFWDGHNAFRPASTQYSSFIFVHDEEQRAAAQASYEAAQKEHGQKPATVIREATDFYTGEFYHTHYYIQRYRELTAALAAVDGIDDLSSCSVDAFSDSPVVSKMNAYVGGFGSRRQMEEDIKTLRVPDSVADDLRAVVRLP